MNGLGELWAGFVATAKERLGITTSGESVGETVTEQPAQDEILMDIIERQAQARAAYLSHRNKALRINAGRASGDLDAEARAARDAYDLLHELSDKRRRAEGRTP